jgi:hypothetical protein
MPSQGTRLDAHSQPDYGFEHSRLIFKETQPMPAQALHPYAQNLVDTVRQMTKVDASKSPGVAFLGALRRELLANGFDVETAERVTAQVDVRLAPGSMPDEMVTSMAKDFGTVLVNIRDALRDQGFQNPAEALVRMAQKMHLKLD